MAVSEVARGSLGAVLYPFGHPAPYAYVHHDEKMIKTRFPLQRPHAGALYPRGEEHDSVRVGVGESRERRPRPRTRAAAVRTPLQPPGADLQPPGGAGAHLRRGAAAQPLQVHGFG
jgi:hypothetical protein